MKTTIETKHFYPDHGVEVGTGGPGYRWTQGYAEALTGGAKSMSLTLREWMAIGRRDGFRVVVHNTESEARTATGGTQ